jgi:hypothetical protein
MTSAVPQPQAKPRQRRFKVAGALMIAAGVLAVAVSAVPIGRGFAGPIGDAVSSPVYTVPFSAGVHLQKGRYLILQAVGAQRIRDITTSDVRVTTAAGESLPVEQDTGNDDLNRNGAEFLAVAQFTTPSAGDFLVAVSGPDSARLVLNRDPFANLSRERSWFELGLLGALLVLGGFVLLIIGFSAADSRSSTSRLVYYGQTPAPPGWHPDPYRPGAWRWWDGNRWQP